VAWPGYYEYGGTEIINASRTETYARNSGVGWFKPAYENEALEPLLGEKYTSPLQDNAPWTDYRDPDTYDFLGAYPLSVTGTEDSTWTATVTENIGDGGVVAGVRRTTKTLVFQVVLVGRSVCGAEAGLRWLREALGGRPCLGPGAGGGGHCDGHDMCYLRCEPHLDMTEYRPPIAYSITTPEDWMLAQGPPDAVASAVGGIYMDTLDQQVYEATVVRTNLLPNPVLTNDATGWYGWVAAPGADLTVVRQTGQTGWAFSVGTSARLTWSVDGATEKGEGIYPGSVPVTAGETYSAAVQVRSNVAQRVSLSFQFYNSSDAMIASSYGVTAYKTNLVPGEVATLTDKMLAPPNAAYAFVQIFTDEGTGFTQMLAGDWMEVTNVHVEATNQTLVIGPDDVAKGVFTGGFTDGVYGPGSTFQFTGTPDVSPSRLNLWTPRDDLGPSLTESHRNPPDDLSSCLTDYLYTLRNVTLTVGPTVQSKQFISDGGAAWVVGFTAVAANPYEWSQEIPLIEGFMDPTVDVPYVDGVVPEGGMFDADGYVQTEVQCPVVEYQPVYDPACPIVIPPPGLPSVDIVCFDFPVNYTRRQFVVPEGSVPVWGDMVPYLQIRAPEYEVRALRLRFYTDVLGGGDPATDPCNFCGDIVFSYIPANSTLIFDGSEKSVTLQSPGGGRRRADSLVFGSDGSPFVWPELTCGVGYIVTIDLPQTQAPPIIDMSLYFRAA
jgi:hypothetical protein